MMYRDGRLIVNGIGDGIRRLSLLIYCRLTSCRYFGLVINIITELDLSLKVIGLTFKR